MDDFWEIAVPMLFLIGSIVLAVFLLTRARRRVEAEMPEQANPIPATASKRQRRILEKLEPDPELPTLMDLVHQEIAELGLEDIPGAAGLPGPVLLKVYRRDHDDACTHDTREFIVADGVDPKDAQEPDVQFHCTKCADQGPEHTEEAEAEQEGTVDPGTNEDGEALPK